MTPNQPEPSTDPSVFAGSVPQSYHTRLVPLIFEAYADSDTETPFIVPMQAVVFEATRSV